VSHHLPWLLQMEGVSPEEHRRLVRELAEAKMKLVSCELELRAALDKLEVYRRADHAAAAAAAEGAASGAAAGLVVSSLTWSLQPDEAKSEAELRLELAQLRQAMALEAGELDKVRGSREWVGAVQPACNISSSRWCVKQAAVLSLCAVLFARNKTSQGHHSKHEEQYCWRRYAGVVHSPGTNCMRHTFICM
jgi:hypothetical protein